MGGSGWLKGKSGPFGLLRRAVVLLLPWMMARDATAQTYADEACASLYRLYNNTGHASAGKTVEIEPGVNVTLGWLNATGWPDIYDPSNCAFCEWFGVLCDPGSQVVELDLTANNLIGTLPPELGSLAPALQALRVGANPFLGGVIPQELCSSSLFFEEHFETQVCGCNDICNVDLGTEGPLQPPDPLQVLGSGMVEMYIVNNHPYAPMLIHTWEEEAFVLESRVDISPDVGELQPNEFLHMPVGDGNFHVGENLIVPFPKSRMSLH
jgi:hypothetical protein